MKSRLVEAEKAEAAPSPSPETSAERQGVTERLLLLPVEAKQLEPGLWAACSISEECRSISSSVSAETVT